MSREEKVRAVEGQRDSWMFQCSVVKQSLEVHRRDNSFEEIQISVLAQLQWFQLSHEEPLTMDLPDSSGRAQEELYFQELASSPLAPDSSSGATFFKLIYLNEAIKHCGRANLDAACTQAHHVCYFMIFEEEEQFKMFRCLANCQFAFVNFKSVSDMMRNASTWNKAESFCGISRSFRLRNQHIKEKQARRSIFVLFSQVLSEDNIDNYLLGILLLGIPCSCSSAFITLLAAAGERLLQEASLGFGGGREDNEVFYLKALRVWLQLAFCGCLSSSKSKNEKGLKKRSVRKFDRFIMVVYDPATNPSGRKSLVLGLFNWALRFYTFQKESLKLLDLNLWGTPELLLPVCQLFCMCQLHGRCSAVCFVGQKAALTKSNKFLTQGCPVPTLPGHSNTGVQGLLAQGGPAQPFPPTPPLLLLNLCCQERLVQVPRPEGVFWRCGKGEDFPTENGWLQLESQIMIVFGERGLNNIQLLKYWQIARSALPWVHNGCCRMLLLEFGWFCANILRKKNSHQKKSSHSPSLLGVSFLQNGPLEGWGEHRCLFQEDQRTGVWELQESAGNESRVQKGQEKGFWREQKMGLTLSEENPNSSATFLPVLIHNAAKTALISKTEHVLLSLYKLASVGLYCFVPPWHLAQTHPLDGPGQWVAVAAAEDAVLRLAAPTVHLIPKYGKCFLIT
ncbi:hypothetical protein IHE44_0014860 [Lamprotornis superbus]|uniref:Uncharacterized protein n=1 Tax=Lamprotornis superbus TaxID=245042 RepID=A0A835P1V0_9PASS|nr:hypothetical protein IHE44_0014860 [Lamprotornis superbus]